MKIKVRLAVTVLITSFILNPSTAFGDEILWEKRLPSGYIVNAGVDIQTVTSSSRLYSVGFYVNKSRPDSLISQIIMDKPLPNSPLSAEKKITGGIWIFSKTPDCINNKTCDQVVQVALPITDSLRETFEGITVNPIQYGNGDFDNFKASDCNAPVRIIQDQAGRGIYEIILSISCLKIPKTFYSYAYMSEDIGLSKAVFNFTNKAEVQYPFYELAEKNYIARGGFEAHNDLVAAEGAKNIALRISSESLVSISNNKKKIKSLQKSGKKGIAAKLNAKNVFLEKEVKSLKLSEQKLNSSEYSPNLKKNVLDLVKQIQKVININLEILNIDIGAK